MLNTCTPFSATPRDSSQFAVRKGVCDNRAEFGAVFFRHAPGACSRSDADTSMSRTRRGRGGRGHHTRETQEMTWFRMDLHLHTPASADYQDLSATYLAILQRRRSAALISSHSPTITASAALRRCGARSRTSNCWRNSTACTPAETEHPRRIPSRALASPCAAGFRVHRRVWLPYSRYLPAGYDYPAARTSPVYAQCAGRPDGNGQRRKSVQTADVLTAYEMINESGGLVIPAHVDGPHGVAMHGSRFGGQTKTAYTQSPYHPRARGDRSR